MAEFENQVLRSRTATGAGDAAIDQGLRSFLIGTYNYMTLGLGITGLVAYFAYSTGFFASIVGTPLVWVVMLAPLAMVFFLSFRINSLSPATAQVLFYVYSALVGLSLAWIFAAYVGADIVKVFFITAASFGALSLYGYTTNRDLTAMGSFLFIGLVGLIIAMIVNFFMQSSALDFAISVIGVGIFAGLTAYDTQKLKEMYYVTAGSTEAAARASIMGALALYLDFLNMFLFLLRLLGNRE
jgi:FtsH-binding integral membrane protein